MRGPRIAPVHSAFATAVGGDRFEVSCGVASCLSDSLVEGFALDGPKSDGDRPSLSTVEGRCFLSGDPKVALDSFFFSTLACATV